MGGELVERERERWRQTRTAGLDAQVKNARAGHDGIDKHKVVVYGDDLRGVARPDDARNGHRRLLRHAHLLHWAVNVSNIGG